MKQLKVNTLNPLVEFLINSKSTDIIKTFDDNFVDLGLSVLWAKCNIGGEEETDYGHYYQWGGLEPMNNKECNWENSPFNNKQPNYNNAHFNCIKNKIAPYGILDKKYDVAYQTYKGKVHMPTKDNFEELKIKTTSKWIENYNNSSVNGRLFTGENGNSIFVPASGYRIYNFTKYIGINALLWCSIINDKNNHNGCNFFISKYSFDHDTNSRCYGFSVRAVKEK